MMDGELKIKDKEGGRVRGLKIRQWRGNKGINMRSDEANIKQKK